MPKTAETEKITFVLPSRLAAEMRAVVTAGRFPSQNALLRDAISRELRRLREEQLRREFAEAARDPLFVQDNRETQQAFASSNAETARLVPEDGWTPS